MVMLLSSRGRVRSRRSGQAWWQPIARAIAGVFPRSASARARAGSTVPAWLALGVALACFGGGFLLGGEFGGGAAAASRDSAQLKAPAGEPRKPGVIGETDTAPLASKAFFVSAYEDADEAVALAKAKALCEFLHGKALLRSRPYRLETQRGPRWTVAVYYDTDAEREATRGKLLALTDVPDAAFVQLRRELEARAKAEGKPGEGWPLSRDIR